MNKNEMNKEKEKIIVNKNRNDKKVVLRYDGHIDSNFAKIFKKVINEIRERHGINRFKVALSSQGGSVMSGFEVYNTLKGLPIEVEMINYNCCMSMAVIIFCAGKRRIATPQSRFLLHGVTVDPLSIGQPLNIGILKTLLKEVKQENKIISKILLENTTWSKNKISRILHKSEETTLLPKEAKKIGLVHEIREKFVEEGEKVIDLNSLIEEEKIRQKILQQRKK